MNTIYEQTLLLDFYGELLTERQREICRMHLQEDWSLGEIAGELGISPQGASDAVRRSMAIVKDMEEKLHMVEAFVNLLDKVEGLERLMQEGAGKDEMMNQLALIKNGIPIQKTI